MTEADSKQHPSAVGVALFGHPMPGLFYQVELYASATSATHDILKVVIQ